MLREALVTLALATSMVAVLPLAPALPDPHCGAVELVEESAQDDADSGADAPDARGASLHLAREGYFWGWLSPVQADRADVHDWYSFDVGDVADELMTNVTSNYTLVYVQTFTLTLFPPDGAPPLTTSSAGPTIRIVDPAPGRYHVELTATLVTSVDSCEPTVLPGAPSSGLVPAQNHGLYVGCHPICVAAAMD